MIEAIPLFPGMSTEQIVFKCTKRTEPSEGKIILTFQVWVFEVLLETIAAVVDKDKVTWAAI